MWLGTVGQSVPGNYSGRVAESPVVAAWGCPVAQRCPWEAAAQQSARSPRGKRPNLGWVGRVCGEDWLAWGGGVPTTGSLSDLAGAHKQASETQASLVAVLLL